MYVTNNSFILSIIQYNINYYSSADWINQSKTLYSFKLFNLNLTVSINETLK